MPNSDAEFEAYMKQFKAQQKLMNRQQQFSQARPTADSILEQSVPQNVSHIPMPPKPFVNPNTCPDCGYVHPPLPGGAPCPMKKTNKEETGGVDDNTVTNHLITIKTTMLANISKKKIKDGNKFFKYIILELTKAIERYNE